MPIPTEPIGSIPRPIALIDAVAREGADNPRLQPLYEEAIRDTIERFEATGSPVISDGEQRKYHNFWTYCVHGLPNTSAEGFRIPFAAGHTRRMPRLTSGPFRYKRYADSYLEVAQRYATVPVKQAVISPSALSLMYPAEGIPGYSRDEFIDDLLREHEAATPPSQKFAREWWAPRSRRKYWESDSASRGRGKAAALGRDSERQEHPACAPARRRGARSGQGGTGAKDGGTCPLAVPDARHAGIHHRRYPGNGRRWQRHRMQQAIRADVGRPPRAHGGRQTPIVRRVEQPAVCGP
jgi:hypothetical protein